MIKLYLNGGPDRCQHFVHKRLTGDVRIDELSFCQFLRLHHFNWPLRVEMRALILARHPSQYFVVVVLCVGLSPV